MARQRFSGPKYANGNHKSQQKAYNRTPKGKSLRVNANRLRRQLKIRKGDPRDAAHYKGSTQPSCSDTRVRTAIPVSFPAPPCVGDRSTDLRLLVILSLIRPATMPEIPCVEYQQSRHARVNLRESKKLAVCHSQLHAS